MLGFDCKFIVNTKYDQNDDDSSTSEDATNFFFNDTIFNINHTDPCILLRERYQ